MTGSPPEYSIAPDLLDFLSSLNQVDAAYLVIGGHAVGLHGHSRATKDIDIWIGSSPENRSAVIAALRVFGAPSRVVDLLRNATPTEFVVFGFPPQRIDLLQWIPGVGDFDVAHQRGVVVDVRGISIRVISRDDLIAAKRAAGRPQDLADVDRLERMQRAATE